MNLDFNSAVDRCSDEGFDDITAPRLIRPLRILARPKKMISGLDSAPDWRLGPEFGEIATQERIRLHES